MKRQAILRWLIYLLGMVLLAAGLTLNTKTGLGVSAIVGIPYVVSVLWGLNFGNATLVMYVLFILVQMLLHGRMYASHRSELVSSLVRDGLQLPLSLLFTRFMNIISAWIPFLTEVAPNQIGTNLLIRILVLLLAVVLTGVGASMTLNMHLVPNPGDGIVKALAQWSGKTTGTMKNLVDALCVAVMLVLGLLFGSRVVGIGIGTVVAALGIGRVIYVFEKHCKQALCGLAGIKTV